MAWQVQGAGDVGWGHGDAPGRLVGIGQAHLEAGLGLEKAA